MTKYDWAKLAVGVLFFGTLLILTVLATTIN